LFCFINAYQDVKPKPSLYCTGTEKGVVLFYGVGLFFSIWQIKSGVNFYKTRTRSHILMRSTAFIFVSLLAFFAKFSCAQVGGKSHAMFQNHMKLIEELNIQPISNATNLSKSASAGSYMTKVYTSPTCSADTLYTASGYVYDHCISVDGNVGYKYSDCSVAGSKTTVKMSYCTSSDCTSGCTTYPISMDTGCKTMSIITCTSSEEPWNDLNFNAHAE
jgi:hypothetical protein